VATAAERIITALNVLNLNLVIWFSPFCRVIADVRETEAGSQFADTVN
jgi:hypothetical protein